MMLDTIINRDALPALRELPAESVHCAVTSPPYYGLRDYGLDAQIGREDTPEQYIKRLVEVFHELKRVLRNDGTFWLNIADTYCGTGSKGNHFDPKNPKGRNGQQVSVNHRAQGCKQKDLIGIPWLLAFALRRDGWYLRSSIIWQKDNPMPESVKDRPTRCYENVFLLTKSKSYYYDAAAIAEPIAPTTAARYRRGRGAKYGARKVKQGYRSHKLKPYRAAAKAEKAAFKANVNFQYHKTLADNPQLAGNPVSRFWQKRQIKRQYAKAAKTGGVKTAKKAAENTRRAAQKTAEKTRQAAAFVARHPAGVCIAIAALLLFIMVSAGLSSCGAMFSGTLNGIVGTSYTSEDSDLIAVENAYAAKESELQNQIDNIERDYPGYDEYRYDLANIGHNPHELASYLTALLQSYTPQSAQAELNRVFDMQYTLSITETVEVRYRTETRTDKWTDEDGNTHSDTYEVEVPYNYYILNVKLMNTPISSFAPELLTPEQLEMFRVYLETSGNKPLLFGGGSPDTSASEDLSGVQFVNGTRPGNTAIVDLAKRQVGNVGGYPYWSWYGFDYRVEWCACFVSWCYGQAGLSEPRFAACQSQGIPWFTSRGQWGARGYENIAPGDAIFFDWDLDGSADHVGLVIGTDGQRVYTVEGNSGDACKIKSYSLDYGCIKGYGLMNWN